VELAIASAIAYICLSQMPDTMATITKKLLFVSSLLVFAPITLALVSCDSGNPPSASHRSKDTAGVIMGPASMPATKPVSITKVDSSASRPTLTPTKPTWRIAARLPSSNGKPGTFTPLKDLSISKSSSGGSASIPSALKYRSIQEVSDTMVLNYQAQVDANALEDMTLGEAQWLIVQAQCIKDDRTWKQKKADSIQRVQDLIRENHLPANTKVLTTILKLPTEVTVSIEVSEQLEIVSGQQDKKQKITTEAKGQWAWRLKAVESGEATIRINVSTDQNEKVIVREMKVNVTPWQFVERFMKDTWPVLLTIGSAIGGVFGFLRNRRKTKESVAAPTPQPPVITSVHKINDNVAITDGPPPQLKQESEKV
jgi:hypothetical protein